jgi:cytochrome c-type biogenesis protein CcmH
VSPEQTKKLQERFIAPCCWSESLAVHRSETAEQMRAEIATLARAGKQEDEIVAFFVARYGERILMEPQGGKSALLTAIPAVAGGMGLLGLVLYLVRFRRRLSE